MDPTIYKLKIPKTKIWIIVEYDVIDHIREMLCGEPFYIKCVNSEVNKTLRVNIYYYEILDGYIDPNTTID